MPKKQPAIPPSQKLYIDLSGRGGLAPRWFGDEGDTTSQYPQYRYIGTQDQTTPVLGESTATDMAAGIWNPSRRYGFMSPANNSFANITQSTGTLLNIISATCYDSLTKTAFYAEWTSGTTINLWQNSTITANAWSLNSNFSWPIAGNRFTDLAMYQINGIPFLFALYFNTSGGGDILVMQPGGSGTGASATWLSAVVSGSFTISSTVTDTFFIPSTYYMYICAGNAVHRLDGTSLTGGSNGTALQNALLVAANVVFTDGISWNGSVYLAACDAVSERPNIYPFSSASYGSTQARVYIWDESVTSIENVEFITVTGVEIVSKLYVTRAGKLRMLCISSKRTMQIREYNGVSFDVIEESSVTGFLSFRKSFQIAGDCVAWIGNDQNIYQHGPVAPGEVDQLTVIGNVSSLIPNGASILTNCPGAMLYLDNNNSSVSRTGFFISAGYYNGSDVFLTKMWYPNQTGNTPHIGNVYSLVKYFPTPVKVNYVRIYHNAGSSTGTTTQGTLSIYLNQATTPTKTFSITTNDVNKGWKYCPINQGAKDAVFSIQAEIQWNTSTTTSDNSDWLTRQLEVDFTPLSKLL